MASRCRDRSARPSCRAGESATARSSGPVATALHIAAQRDFEIDRCFVRDPSRSAPLGYAGIRILRQSQTLLGSMDGRGFGNRIELTGATRPLGGLVIDEGSQGVSIEATVRSTAAA
jgi:hypothetical protein